MAIPSVFTAVHHDGKILVDGGISRNFPVRDVKEMGADYVIGSTVANGLLPPEKVKNVIQLLLQIAFFREAEDTKNEVPLCDIYIPFDLSKYNMGSFGDADAILEKGIEEGRKLYPRFKHLADSLNGIYGKQEIIAQRLPQLKKVYIDEYEIRGLNNTTRAFFINTMNFKLSKEYYRSQLAEMVRQAFGTRYYQSHCICIEYPRAADIIKLFLMWQKTRSHFLKAGCIIIAIPVLVLLPISHPAILYCPIHAVWRLLTWEKAFASGVNTCNTWAG